MYDPLGTSPFADDTPPWPTTPHPPNSPIPNLRRASYTQAASSEKAPSSPPHHAEQHGKEPQIYGQPEAGLISPTANTASNGTKYEKLEPYLRARITMLDRNRRDILIRLDAQTNLSNFTGSTYRNVSRSYAEFQQFYEALVHNSPQTIVPALPLAQTSAPTDEEDDRLVKIMLQRWLTRVCDDPFLMQDEETRSFIESDFGYQPMPRNPRKKSGSGFSLLRRAVPDEDETLQQARFNLAKQEGLFFDTAKAIDKLARTRKTLSVAQAELGNKLISVASSETHPPLSNALRKLGRTSHSVSDLDQASAISECVIIGDSFGYQGMNAKSARETLQQRTAVLEEYQAAVKNSISKRRYIERLKASSNITPSKVGEALEDMEEADKYEKILAQRVDGISHNLHLALDRHNKLVKEDVKAALIEYTRSTLSYERQRLREMEALLPDIETADKKVVPVSGPVIPSVVPKLDDVINRPSEGLSSRTGQAVPSKAPSSFGTPRDAPALPSKGNVPPPLSFQSPGAGSSTSANPQVVTKPSSASSRTEHPADTPRSVPHTPASPSVGPTGHTKTVVSSVPSAPLHSASSTQSNHNTTTASSADDRIYREPDPLGPLGPTAQIRRTIISSTFASPLEQTAISPLSRNNGETQTEIDPLGLGRPSQLSQSVRTPTKSQRSRLDAREAASKLANMF